jgi:hypothetical protein
MFGDRFGYFYFSGLSLWGDALLILIRIRSRYQCKIFLAASMVVTTSLISSIQEKSAPSPDGGDKANSSLVQTLRVMMAEIVAGATLYISGISAKLNDRGEITDPDPERALRSLLNILVGPIDRC